MMMMVIFSDEVLYWGRETCLSLRLKPVLRALCTDSKHFEPGLCVSWVSCFVWFFSPMCGREVIQAHNPSSCVTLRLVYLA